MQAKGFLKKEYPITFDELKNNKCQGVNDIAYIMRKYSESELYDFAHWLYNIDKLRLVTQLPLFETPDMIVEQYKKEKQI